MDKQFNTQEVWWGWWFLIVIVIVYFVCVGMDPPTKTDPVPIHTTEAASSPENFRKSKKKRKRNTAKRNRSGATRRMKFQSGPTKYPIYSDLDIPQPPYLERNRENYARSASAEGGTGPDFTSWTSSAPDIPTSPPIWTSPAPDIPTSPPIWASPAPDIPAVEEPGCPSEIPGVYPDALDPEFRKCQAQKMAACYAKCHSIDPLYFLYNP